MRTSKVSKQKAETCGPPNMRISDAAYPARSVPESLCPGIEGHFLARSFIAMRGRYIYAPFIAALRDERAVLSEPHESLPRSWQFYRRERAVYLCPIDRGSSR